MHVENELVEFVTVGEQEYEGVIEEYEEEVLVQEEAPQPPMTNISYNYIETTCIDKPTYESY